MKPIQALRDILLREDINFLLTNRIPRNTLTRAMGWFSRVRHPWVVRFSIAIWRLFTDLDLDDAAKSRFDSLHDCFTRELKPGARPLDHSPDRMTSPCDGIVGECGLITHGRLFQAKGMDYTLAELLGCAVDAAALEGGCYLTLRLTSAMYHRFHAPYDMWLRRVDYISGDTWNVNPIALKRVERLFCRNERAAIHATLADSGHAVVLVPVAAVLVASIRLHCVDVLLHLKYRGPNRIDCDTRATKGEELGWFEHGSTIIVLAPAGFTLCEGVHTGATLRMGQPAMRLPVAPDCGDH